MCGTDEYGTATETKAMEENCSPKEICDNTPRIRDTDHLFLELPLLREKLEEYINTMSVAGSWSQNAVQATNAWLKEGLRPRCITRDLKWGVPVPHEKYKDKVMFPSTLLGTGERWTMMKTISVTEYLNYESGTIDCLFIVMYLARFSLTSGKASYRPVHTGPAADWYANRSLPLKLAFDG
ncbi:hypothetical protein BHE74_00035164 [Ensete ventricosum]|uniref:Methionyl/Leucyl tRNA synthetase domain-containing protein n=1 Tax=Ensete ventricosum TaxID=4639 RepID=A0A427ANX4_ENSVE|nr:hypothetical protein B296_00000443 [Ensete ventricosum]RWW26601.1 hypothetical protein GW17_00009006 [Ensete ventricosum]RWW58011.1 hypothetical protein BHE74_00035164 [Ensete ventricosum]RZR84325.1 hypothetical protein BHM03_00011122 [Ensete ventricosum]